MKKPRSAARWIAGVLLLAGLATGAYAPAQADTGWNGTAPKVVQDAQLDTGWNGT